MELASSVRVPINLWRNAPREQITFPGVWRVGKQHDKSSFASPGSRSCPRGAAMSRDLGGCR
jgi:hypothetical protein